LRNGGTGSEVEVKAIGRKSAATDRKNWAERSVEDFISEFQTVTKSKVRKRPKPGPKSKGRCVSKRKKKRRQGFCSGESIPRKPAKKKPTRTADKEKLAWTEKRVSGRTYKGRKPTEERKKKTKKKSRNRRKLWGDDVELG